MAELIGKFSNMRNKEPDRITFAKFAFGLTKDYLDLYCDKWVLSSVWPLRLNDKTVTDTMIKCENVNNYIGVDGGYRYSIRVPGITPVYMWTNDEEDGYFVAAKFKSQFFECSFLRASSIPEDSNVKILPLMAGILVSQNESKSYASS